MGHTFTDEDKAALKQSGNMGRVVDLVDKHTGELIPSYISIDRLTNNIEAIVPNAKKGRCSSMKRLFDAPIPIVLCPSFAKRRVKHCPTEI
ncbi:hypothetical protein BN938_2701 [Mucinivorans hirudinis]|uniref:Uncharacterized protein n=1 Tax=Mucinivorans hirudinis TaxID=1433126 RepID=A0A060RAV9_9BACT|nr:hypothetical protein BN938_2701 [Mucinivorans hirudinis]